MSLPSMELEMTALADKVAIVTGASSGIGHATARLFAREGARVVVTARRQAELDAFVASIEEEGGDALAVAGDIRDKALAKLLVETAVDRFGGLDVAFNMPARPARWRRFLICRSQDGARPSRPT
jgi:NAD(P)-dependent dehydrogenase (short-subunit alcohol dehydrogenase family)